MSKKSRKLIRATPAAQDVAEVVPEPEAPGPERTFFFLPDVEPVEVDERELHAEMKLWRHGRATRIVRLGDRAEVLADE